MADNATTIVRWSYRDPDEDGSGGDGEQTGGTEDGGSIDLELADEFDIIGYCEAARRLIKAHNVPDGTKATITKGTIGAGREVVDTYNETITFRNTDRASVKKDLSELTWHWADSTVISTNGEHVSPPSVTYEDGTFTLSEKIGYGNLIVSGRQTYQEYIVEISEDAVAVFTWDGGVADIEVPLPDMQCETEIDPDDHDYVCWQRTFYVDPCSGIITRQEKGRIGCDEMTHSQCSERSDAD